MPCPTDRDRIAQSTTDTRVFSSCNDYAITEHYEEGRRRQREWGRIPFGAAHAVEVARALAGSLGPDAVAVFFQEGQEDPAPLWTELLVHPDRLADVIAILDRANALRGEAPRIGAAHVASAIGGLSAHVG